MITITFPADGGVDVEIEGENFSPSDSDEEYSIRTHYGTLAAALGDVRSKFAAHGVE